MKISIIMFLNPKQTSLLGGAQIIYRCSDLSLNAYIIIIHSCPVSSQLARLLVILVLMLPYYLLFWTSDLTCRRTNRGHTGGRSHTISPLSFAGAYLYFLSREGFSRPFSSSSVKSNLFIHGLIVLYLLGIIFYFLFIYFCEEKSHFV